jgi:hypothetical protein
MSDARQMLVYARLSARQVLDKLYVLHLHITLMLAFSSCLPVTALKIDLKSGLTD